MSGQYQFDKPCQGLASNELEQGRSRMQERFLVTGTLRWVTIDEARSQGDPNERVTSLVARTLCPQTTQIHTLPGPQR